ncbi:MerR family transcriptional regulator [Aliiroseovarius sp. 2305UL8-7]|uniref:MerR family transcriptional regulator n=1 Tax=Aliiroseovarius conchicola TaxID=3121637 RepID=UPI0035289A6C
MDKKSPDAFRTISEVADWLGVPTHVLRFWESRFSQVKPVKRAGGRRYYRPTDMELLGGIRKLLHDDGMTIRGVQKLLREEGVKHVAAMSPPLDSDEMRDVTPSNVVSIDPKAVEPEPPVAAVEDDAPSQDAETPVEEIIARVTSASDEEPTAHAPPSEQEASDKTGIEADAATPADHMQPDEQTPAESTTVDASETPHVSEPDMSPEISGGDDMSDTQAVTTLDADSGESATSEQPPLFGSGRTTAETPDDIENPAGDLAHAADEQIEPEPTSSPASNIDISHISADPADDAPVLAGGLIATAIRSARQSGTDAHIAALQALADRLESLGAQMGDTPGNTP